MSPTAFIGTLVQAAQWFAAGAGNSYFAISNAVLQQAAAMVLTALWQGTLVACGLALFLRLSPRTSAEHRFAIWALAFATIVGLPFLAFVAGFPFAAQSAAAAGGAVVSGRPVFSVDTRWSLPIVTLWAAATLYRFCDLAFHSFMLRKLWCDAVPVNPGSNLGAFLAAVKATSKRRTVEVCTTTLQRPSVIGFLKPRILIPDSLFARLTPGELEQIVLHEAEHLRRYDDWTNLLQKIFLALFPLNPALVFIERRLCCEREMACDEGVIEITRAPRAYAACLTSLAERGIQRRAEALSLGAWQRRPELVHRVHSILRSKRKLGPVGTRVLLGTFACALLAGSLELARCPQLIAFVPPQNHDLSSWKQILPANTDERRVSVRLVNSSLVTTGSAYAGKGGASARAKKADQEVRLAKPVNCTASEQREGATQAISVLRKTQSLVSAQSAPRKVLLKAQMPGSQSTSNEPQQWVVLTTWAQVESSDHNSSLAANGLTADYETAGFADASITSNNAGGTGTIADGTASPKAKPANQITITRLILKIYSGASVSSQPAFVPVQDGWFVIQL